METPYTLSEGIATLRILAAIALLGLALLYFTDTSVPTIIALLS